MEQLLACENLGQFLNKACEMIKDELAADRCALWLLDEERGELWTKLINYEIRIPGNAGFAGQVAESRQPLLVPFDLYDHSGREVVKKTDQKTGYRTCSILCVPVLNDRSSLVGVIQCINKQRSGNFPPYNPENWPEPPEVWQISFTQEDRDRAIAFGQQIMPLLDSFLEKEKPALEK